MRKMLWSSTEFPVPPNVEFSTLMWVPRCHPLRQHIQEVMQQFRNKIVYDADTGKVKNNRNFLSMMEDFWIPRRGDGKSTEIQTLPGAQGLSDIEDLLFFKNKVYQSLKVPRNRIQSDNNFSLGRATEITREEILFSKFVQRLRNNFNVLFKQALRVQLRLKNIVSETEWEEIKNLIPNRISTRQLLRRIEAW